MSDKTVEKLRSHLGTHIDNEPAVVYRLSIIRKLIDRIGAPKPSFALRMYCHWALHINLDRAETTQTFLNLVDRFILKNVSPGGSSTWPVEYVDDGTFSVEEEYHLFRDFVYLNDLRAGLRDYLAFYGLPEDLCTSDELWFAFLAAFAGVIEDGELAIGGKADTLRAVKKVIFQKGGQPLSRFPHVPFVLQWNIYFKDGRIFKFSVEADSDKKSMWNIRLTGNSKYESAM